MLAPIFCSSDTVTPLMQKSSKSEMAGLDLTPPKEKKKISSPRSKTKTKASKVFGAPLKEILETSPHPSGVPFLVRRICQFIIENGISQEGIFRVNGNMKVVEQLKAQFDKNGDADLDSCGDIMAVAGLLKLYLRTLPDPVITEKLHNQLIEVHKVLHKEKDKIKVLLRDLLNSLPSPNIHLLKYLCEFLVTISNHSEDNKMTGMALAIVFGPNIFRCSLGFEGLREQSHVNAIVCLWVDDYDYYFAHRDLPPVISNSTDPREPPPKPEPYHEYKSKSKSLKPARPPPPNLYDYQRSNSEIIIGHHHHSSLLDPKDTSIKRAETSPIPLLSIDESNIISSGLNGQDQESPISKEPTPSTSPPISVPAGKGHQVVDSVVRGAVREHLFGPHGVLSSSSESESHFDQNGATRLRNQENAAPGDTNDSKSVKDRIKRLVTNRSHSADIGSGGSNSSSSSNQNRRGSFVNVGFNDEDPDFEMEPYRLDRSTEKSFDFVGSKATGTLSSITTNRAQLPKNRRRPSFSRLQDDSEVDTATLARRRLEEAKNARGELRARSLTDRHTLPMNKNKSHSDSDILLNAAPSRGSNTPSRSAIRMDIDRAQEYRDETTNSPNHLRAKSMDVQLAAPTSPLTVGSPSTSKVNNVPPLDLVCLQSDDAEQAQPSPMGRYQHVIADGPVRSPRSSGNSDDSPVKDDAPNTVLSYDDPPSPPQIHREQIWLEKRQDTVPLIDMSPKDLKKRIESLKKIITNFENSFEQQHGRKPKPSEKGHVQKYIAEFGRAKKQLKELMVDLKDHPERLSDSAQNLLDVLPPCHDAVIGKQGPEQTKEETLNCLLKKLQEKRQAAGRPEEIQAMSEDQLTDEKLSVQKSLLQYESIHCRPTSKEDKNFMRPLYERYRRIKRILAKSNASKSKDISLDGTSDDGNELNNQTENDSPRKVSALRPENHESPRKPSIVRTIVPSPLIDEDELGDTFSVTSRVTETSSAQPDITSPGKRSTHVSNLLDEAVLHDATLDELLQQQNLAKKSKKKIGKKLKVYEEEFFRETGRKITKEDRGNMENDYREYKITKARLRLLEALILKKNHVQMV